MLYISEIEILSYRLHDLQARMFYDFIGVFNQKPSTQKRVEDGKLLKMNL